MIIVALSLLKLNGSSTNEYHDCSYLARNEMFAAGLVQRQLRKRGIKVWTSLARLFRQLDESGDGKLNKYELEKAMVDYHIDIPQEVSIFVI